MRDRRVPAVARVVRWLYATIIGYSDPHSHVRWLAIQRALKTIKSTRRRASVLEIGSGPGAMTYEIRRLLCPTKLLACDIDFAWGWPSVAYCFKADATHLPVSSNSQDVVVLADVIEHIDADDAALREAFRVTTPGGYVLTSVPTPAYPRWFGREMHQRIGHVRDGYTRQELLTALRRAGFISIHARYHTGLLFLLLAWLYYRHLPLRMPLPELATLLGRLLALLDAYLPSPPWGGLVIAAMKPEPYGSRRRRPSGDKPPAPA